MCSLQSFIWVGPLPSIAMRKRYLFIYFIQVKIINYCGAHMMRKSEKNYVKNIHFNLSFCEFSTQCMRSFYTIK